MKYLLLFHCNNDYKTSEYILNNSICSPPILKRYCRRGTVASKTYGMSVVIRVVVSWMWFCGSWPHELFCYAKNLIQYQVRESQCSQSGEGSAHNLDKALVPATYFRARSCKIIKNSSPQNYPAVSTDTQVPLFSESRVDEKWFHYLQTINLKEL